MVNIAIVNHSPNLKLTDLEVYVAAYMVQANEQYAPAHGVLGVNLYITDTPKPSDWVITFVDNATAAGALGLHDVTPTGMPLGLVFVKTTLDAGSSVSVCGSHELLEMMGDPLIVTAMEYQPGVFRAFEVADAPEDDQYGYEINGVLVSDWVYTSWFDPIRPGPFDYKGHIQKAGEILPGGYIGQLDAGGAQWTQVFNSAKRPAAHHMGLYGTRFDRRIRRHGLRRSSY